MRRRAPRRPPRRPPRRRFNIILPGAASRQLFALLLEPPRNLTRRVVALVAKAALFAWRDRSCAGSMLLNIGHSGPEQPQYVAWLRRRGLRPVFMIHDVIPVTHPEYCRPPERQRHMRRLDAVLRSASAVITNSGATLRALSEYARSRGLVMPPTIAAPLAEALSLGVPAIASDLPVFREIAADIPEYLDPLDALGWLRCIESFCQPDSPLRQNQLLKMSRFIPPAWAAHFETFEGLLRQV